jgi:hypothetical protein
MAVVGDTTTWDGSASVVRCAACGAAIPLDVTRVRLSGDQPLIGCLRCPAMVPVPVFGTDEPVGADASDPAASDAPAPDPVTQAQAAYADREELMDMNVPDSPPFAQEAPALIERRSPRHRRADIACRACGKAVTLQPGNMRLTWTHALLRCPSCRAEVHVRRSDAYKGVDTDLPWSFAAYVDDQPEPSAPEPQAAGMRRLFRRKH